MQRNKKNVKTVSDKYTDIILKTNADDYSSDESVEATAPKVVDFSEDDYELPDARTTDIRKRNVKLLSDQSTRYHGKTASRKDFEESLSEDESQDEDSNSPKHEFSMRLKNNINSDEGSEQSAESDEESDNADTDDQSDTEEIDQNDTTNDIFSKHNTNADVQKGVCVQNQLAIWEKMLEIRIHSQKLLNKANQLPSTAAFKLERKQNKQLHTLSEQSSLSITNLLQNLLKLQHTLFGQFSEIKKSMKKASKRPAPNVETNTDATRTKRFAEHLENNFNEFKPYRNEVLLKWDDRTKLLTLGTGLKQKNLNEDYGIMQKINNTMINRSALIGKSQILKGNAATEDIENTASQQNANVYDDTDFYLQQLRELIEFKANSTSNAALVTNQLIELQKLRQKMKKKVDTRASKGRKIHYTVHNKLINFMAPNDDTNWTEESTNELCKSLFAS